MISAGIGTMLPLLVLVLTRRLTEAASNFECQDVSSTTYRSQCKQTFAVSLLIGLNSDDPDTAWKFVELMKPALDPCIAINAKDNKTSIFQFAAQKYRSADTCPFDPFGQVRNISRLELEESEVTGAYFSPFTTFRSGDNVQAVNVIMNNVVRQIAACNLTDFQPVVFFLLDMYSATVLKKFAETPENSFDSLAAITENDVVVKIIFTSETNISDPLRSALDDFLSTSQGNVDYTINDLTNATSVRELFGLCAVAPDAVTPEPEKKQPYVALIVGVGASLIVLFLIVVVIVVLFTTTNILDRPAYWFYGKLERWLGLKLKFLQHADHTDDGFERYVQQWNREADPWEVDPQNLHISAEKLGSGAYAIVHSGILSGMPPICKMVPQAALLGLFNEFENPVAVKRPHDSAGAEEKWDFLQEISFMKRLDYHPHVLSMLGCSTFPIYPFIVFELCELGDLLSILQQLAFKETAAEVAIQPDDFLAVSWQISDALVYLSTKNLIHRDIAARNVLITKGKMAKLCDFGLCRESVNLMYTSKKNVKIPIRWMAPESIEKAEYSTKSDIWSFGVLLYEIYSFGAVPYPVIETEDVLAHIKAGHRLDLPRGAPDFIREAMSACWLENPNDRPQPEDLSELFYSRIEANANSYGYLQFNSDDGLVDDDDDYDMMKKKDDDSHSGDDDESF